MKGSTYQKGARRCNVVDWLERDHADTYAIDAEVDAATYEDTGMDCYEKVAPDWAGPVSEAGQVESKEGATDYWPAAHLVPNHPAGRSVGP